MPYKRKDSPVWWASYVDASGKRVRRSTGSTSRKEAEALEAKWKLEVYRLQQWEEQPERSFDELMLIYIRATENEKRSAERDKTSLANLYPFFTGRSLNSLTRKDINAYISQRKTDGVVNATINREVSLLSAAINYAINELEWDILNPAQGRKLKIPEARICWISRVEAAALIQASGNIPRADHLPDFIRLALHTGCRKNELLKLDWQRVDLKNALFYLEGEHTKAGKRRTVPLNSEAKQALLNRARFRASHCPDSPWVFCNKQGGRVNDLKNSFATACKRVGIQDFRIHDLRHTCAAWLVTSGVPLTEIRDLLGHSSVTMTEKYAHLAPENVRAAVQRLEHYQDAGHDLVTLYK